MSARTDAALRWLCGTAAPACYGTALAAALGFTYGAPGVAIALALGVVAARARRRAR